MLNEIIDLCLGRNGNSILNCLRADRQETNKHILLRLQMNEGFSHFATVILKSVTYYCNVTSYSKGNKGPIYTGSQIQPESELCHIQIVKRFA